MVNVALKGTHKNGDDGLLRSGGYALNSWARIGPAGYGSAAASPPS